MLERGDLRKALDSDAVMPVISCSMVFPEALDMPYDGLITDLISADIVHNMPHMGSLGEIILLVICAVHSIVPRSRKLPCLEASMQSS